MKIRVDFDKIIYKKVILLEKLKILARKKVELIKEKNLLTKQIKDLQEKEEKTFSDKSLSLQDDIKNKSKEVKKSKIKVWGLAITAGLLFITSWCGVRVANYISNAHIKLAIACCSFGTLALSLLSMYFFSSENRVAKQRNNELESLKYDLNSLKLKKSKQLQLFESRLDELNLEINKLNSEEKNFINKIKKEKQEQMNQQECKDLTSGIERV